jgi:hypothetical protein
MSSWKRCKNFVFFAPRLILVAIFMSVVVAMMLGNFDLMEPYLFPLHLAQGRITSYGSRITIGHFPQAYELARLQKERGVDLDISLLSNDLPQEKALNGQLAKEAQKLGIEFKSVPLGYLNLDSAENKKQVSQLVTYLQSHGSRRVYIHCYLGRHRVNVVRDELVRLGVIPQAVSTGGA